ncbi:DNA-processing protein DprA [bacterium]|nr:DNA-processing protein DprA [bacterium]
MDERQIYIFFNLLSIGYRSLLLLKNEFGSLSNAIKANEHDLLKIKGIRKNTVNNIIEKRDSSILDKELALCKKSGCRIITIEDSEYPEQLKEISLPPLVLYVKGELMNEDKNAIAMIGTRRPSQYGKKIMRKLSYDLAEQGVTIISGLAKGLDSCAHNSALEANGRTIAVLGSGLECLYPRENKKLARIIEQSGAVISEFPLETSPYRSNFPIRNRIISGLSLGTIVVEAAVKSGSLITAGFALEQNRTVFAVPGNIDSPYSEGTNNLIKQGAVIANNAEAVFREIPYLKRINKGGNEKIAHKINFSEKEKTIIDLVSKQIIHIDKILDKTEFTAPELTVLLLSLEMKNVVKQLSGKYYTLQPQIIEL